MDEENHPNPTRIVELGSLSSQISNFDEKYEALGLRGDKPSAHREIVYREYNGRMYFCLNQPIAIEADLIKDNNPELITYMWDYLHQIVVLPRENLSPSVLEEKMECLD